MKLEEKQQIIIKFFYKKCVLQPDGSKEQLAISRSKITIQDPGNIFARVEVDTLNLQGTFPVIYIDFKDCCGKDTTLF